MMIAGAALSLMQTAVAALRPEPGSGGAADATPRPGGPKPAHPPGKAGQSLSESLQAVLKQVQEAGTPDGAAPARDLGRALKAYAARTGASPVG